jgi:hypothetical protein
MEHMFYEDIVKMKMKNNTYGIAYDHQCKDPICNTIVKALYESSQGSGWSFMWALDISADDSAFEEQFANMCGNCISAIECAINRWETYDETDYNNAMIVYKRLLLERVDDEEPCIFPPILLKANV